MRRDLHMGIYLFLHSIRRCQVIFVLFPRPRYTDKDDIVVRIDYRCCSSVCRDVNGILQSELLDPDDKNNFHIS